jgi:hypothetical protein
MFPSVMPQAFASLRKRMGEMGGKFVKGNWAKIAHSALLAVIQNSPHEPSYGKVK